MATDHSCRREQRRHPVAGGVCHRWGVSTRWRSSRTALVVLLLLAASCTTESAQLIPGDIPPTTTATTTTTTTTTTTSPEAPTDPADPEPDSDNGEPPATPDEQPAPETEQERTIPPEQDPTGQIAVIGTDGDLLVVSPEGTELGVLTDHDDDRVSQPTWSRSGELLAWTETTEVDELVVGTPDGQRSSRARTPFASFFNGWSPDDSRIAMLGNSRTGIGLSLVGVEGESLTADPAPADGGQPYFFDWVSDNQLYTHIADEVRTFDLGDAGPGGAGSSAAEPEVVGAGFGSPEVLSDGTALVVVESPSGFQLERRNLDGSNPTALANLGFNALIVADPTEELIAIHVLGEPTPSPPTTINALQQSDLPTLGGGVWVLSLSTGEAVQIADSERIGMFWDPTGTRLLMLAPDEGRSRWQVWSIDGSWIFTEAVDLSPTLWQNYLPFADQYAKNITFWSPEGSSFVYSAFDEGGLLTIYVHNASRNGASTPIARGSVAIWSPSGGGGSGQSRL